MYENLLVSLPYLISSMRGHGLFKNNDWTTISRGRLWIIIQDIKLFMCNLGPEVVQKL